ncbi:MAG: hypothetical protein ACE5ES_00575 [Candidatus Nanoarchaeia archaeon]
MLVKLDNPLLLSKAVEIISELVTEVRIKVNESGMSITAIDPANVAMVGFKLPRAAFSQFEISTEKIEESPESEGIGGEVLGVNLDNLKKILRRAGSGSSLILEKKENVLEIAIQDRIKRNFLLSLIEIDSEDKSLPELEFSSSVELNSEDLVDAIEDCGVVADACSLEIQEDQASGKNYFLIHAKGLNSAKAEFSANEVKIDAEPCRSKYSLEYFQKFMKASKLSDKTILKFANDHPMRMDVKTQDVEMNFILAPRVETED